MIAALFTPSRSLLILRGRSLAGRSRRCAQPCKRGCTPPLRYRPLKSDHAIHVMDYIPAIHGLRWLRDSRGNGGQLFLLAADCLVCLRLHSRLPSVASASMPPLLGWHRARASPFHATGGSHTPTSMSASLAIANWPSTGTVSKWQRVFVLHTGSAVGTSYPIPPRVEITPSAMRFARRLCWNINTRSSARMDTGFASATSLCGRL